MIIMMSVKIMIHLTASGSEVKQVPVIHHILKDGTEVSDVTGHVIKADKFTTLYQVVNRINERINHEAVRTSEARS